MPQVEKELKDMVEGHAKEIKNTVAEVHKAHKVLDELVEKIGKDVGEHGTELASTKVAFQDQVVKVTKIEDTLDDLVEKLTKMPSSNDNQFKSIGVQAAECANIKEYRGGNLTLCEFEGSLHRKDVTSAGASAGDTIEPYLRPGIQAEPDRQAVVRDLLITLTIASNSVEWVQENVFTNNAASKAEGAAAAKSDITFTKQNSPVQIISHWMAASRQVLSDSRSLRSLIDGRLVYGLKYEEEDQLLLGDGTGTNLNGLVPQATAFNAALSVSGDTKVDQLRRAILQVSLNKYMTSAITLNPADWCDLELSKTDDNAYLFSNPVNPGQPRLWGKRIVEGLSMTAGEFLLGDFGRAATLWDREQATVRASEHHANFFIEGMVALICEERLALTVEHPLGLVTGALAATP